MDLACTSSAGAGDGSEVKYGRNLRNPGRVRSNVASEGRLIRAEAGAASDADDLDHGVDAGLLGRV
jgi:hypothetical protein